MDIRRDFAVLVANAVPPIIKVDGFSFTYTLDVLTNYLVYKEWIENIATPKGVHNAVWF